MSIVLNNISKFYGQQRALDQISFEAKEGEILGLLGPNGAGKTTCMKIISCFTPASEGEASVYGFDPSSQALDVKRILGYLPEHNPLYGSMYVKEYLSFVAGIHKIKNKKARIAELIELTGLDKEQNKMIGQLSKGYKQRVGIAQALIHDPKVLILDEPISGLDPNQIVEIRQLIKSLKEDKVIIFSSHILQEVESLCDKVVILDNGKIVADNEIEQISTVQHEVQPLIVEFKNDVDLIKLQAIDGTMKIEPIDSKKYVIYDISKSDIRELLFDFAVSEGNKLLEMHSSKKSLENVFKSLTK